MPLSPSERLPHPERCALLVIDFQERLAPAMPAAQLAAVLRNARILIETACEFQLPLLVSEQYPKGLGPTLPEIRALLPPEVRPFEKLAFSCAREAAFEALLKPYPAHDILLCGMETHVCVLQTTLDLLQRGHRVYVAADAVCSRSELNHQLGLDLMRQAGAVIGSTEIFAFGLLGAAGTERFKRISRWVK